MASSRSLLRTILAITGLIVLVSCDLSTPVEFAGYTLQVQEQEVFKDKTQPICRAIEAAGYIMPYGPVFGWYHFGISQSRWILSGPGATLLTIPAGESYMLIVADWNIPGDFNSYPDPVTQNTIDHLAQHAKKICRIVQREAAKQDIGPVKVTIWLRNLVVGWETEFGMYDANHQGEGWRNTATSDCEKITGVYTGKSIGLNPQSRTPGRCPSLYVPG